MKGLLQRTDITSLGCLLGPRWRWEDVSRSILSFLLKKSHWRPEHWPQPHKGTELLSFLKLLELWNVHRLKANICDCLDFLFFLWKLTWNSLGICQHTGTENSCFLLDHSTATKRNKGQCWTGWASLTFTVHREEHRFRKIKTLTAEVHLHRIKRLLCESK